VGGKFLVEDINSAANSLFFFQHNLFSTLLLLSDKMLGGGRTVDSKYLSYILCRVIDLRVASLQLITVYIVVEKLFHRDLFFYEICR